MTVRPATHAGSWYSSGPGLRTQLERWFSNEHAVIPSCRVLIGPHAGFSYSGERLGETFKVWDTSGAKRIFILGPSHHVYFRNYVMVSGYDLYDTPLGRLKVDTTVTAALAKHSVVKTMSEEADEDEHSFEMHCPFIKYRNLQDNADVKIVPVMISSLDALHVEEVVTLLKPYFSDPQNSFSISSDFCHWGSRFGYTEYIQSLEPELKLVTLGARSSLSNFDIYESIEILDKLALEIAQKGSSELWDDYIQSTGNTICGQKPMLIVLRLLELVGGGNFSWLGYSQSSQVTHPTDSSVSYASGYASFK